MKPVNFGIDLGTTNSLIAKYENNKVLVFKNPVGQRETLASVVAYRNDRIMVGDKAREYITKDPINVFGSFKRKMGTDEKYYEFAPLIRKINYTVIAFLFNYRPFRTKFTKRVQSIHIRFGLFLFQKRHRTAGRSRARCSQHISDPGECNVWIFRISNSIRNFFAIRSGRSIPN